MIRTLALATLTAAVLTGCSSTATTADQPTAPASSTTITVTAAPPTTTSTTAATAKAGDLWEWVPPPTSAAAAPPALSTTIAANCAQPPDGVQKLIDGSFTGGEHIQDIFAVAGPGKLIYVGGNIMGSDGTKESSADVWLVKDEGIYIVYSLSGDARRRTTWPDGRKLASAGDQYGSAVQDCVTTAERARNTSGG